MSTDVADLRASAEANVKTGSMIGSSKRVPGASVANSLRSASTTRMEVQAVNIINESKKEVKKWQGYAFKSMAFSVGACAVALGIVVWGTNLAKARASVRTLMRLSSRATFSPTTMTPTPRARAHVSAATLTDTRRTSGRRTTRRTRRS